MSPYIVFGAKLLALALVLRLTRVLSLRAAGLYVGGSVALVLLFPQEAAIIPFEVMFYAALALLAYVSVLVAWSWAGGRARISIGGMKVYTALFSSVFVISAAVLSLGLHDLLSLAAVFAALLAIDYTREKAKVRLPRFISFNWAAVLVVPALALMGKYGALLLSAGFGLAFCALMFVYAQASEVLTRNVKADNLKAGMFLAETFFNKKGKYYKKRQVSLTLLSAARSIVTGKLLSRQTLVSPLEPLTIEKAEIVRQICRQNGIKNVRVQNTLDTKLFVLAGLVLAAVL